MFIGIAMMGSGAAITVASIILAGVYVSSPGTTGIAGLLGGLVTAAALMVGGFFVLKFGRTVNAIPGCRCGGPGPRTDWHQGAGTYVLPCPGCGRTY